MGVIISSLLIKYYQMDIADPICSTIISVLILASVIPLLRTTIETLLLKCPPDFAQNMSQIKAEVAQIEGVNHVKKFHIFALKPN